jgi:hypothetical protein
MLSERWGAHVGLTLFLSLWIPIRASSNRPRELTEVPGAGARFPVPDDLNRQFTSYQHYS